MRTLQKSLLRRFEFRNAYDHHPQLAPDLAFGQADVFLQSVGFDCTDDEQVDEARVLPQRIVIKNIDGMHVAQIGPHFLDDPVDAEALFDDGVQFRENGVVRVGAEEEGAALFLFFEVAGFGQAIEFFLDRVGRDREFRGQLPQVAGHVGVEEEFEQQLDARLGGEELREHGDFVQIF